MNVARAAFRLLGDSLDPERVTSLLSVTPTSAVRKDQVLTYTTDEGRERLHPPAPTGSWDLVSEPPTSEPLERHLEQLMAVLEPRASVIHELRASGLRAEIACVVMAARGRIQLPPEMLERMGRLGVVLVVEFFGGTS